MLTLVASLTSILLVGPVTGNADTAAYLMKRSIQAGLAANAAWDGSTYRCPSGSNIFFEKFCCPDGYEYDAKNADFTSYVCCPMGGVDCSKPVLDCPICANSDWSYWDINATSVPPILPFCCEQGYAPAADPPNVCTSGALQFTDYTAVSEPMQASGQY